MQLNQVKKIWHKVAALRQHLKSLILSSTKHEVSRLHCREGCGFMHDYPWYFLAGHTRAQWTGFQLLSVAANVFLQVGGQGVQLRAVDPLSGLACLSFMQ